MPFPRASAGDERPHTPGPEPLWSESWYFDFASASGDLGGYVRIGRYPNLGVCWYWACLVGADRRLVTVIDHAVPLPRVASSLEIRTDGLWADHTCEAPLDHWSLGLEAFGVALDDPRDAYGDLRGDRTPLGFDLEWETAGAVFPWPEGMDRYEVPCRVHGEILVADETIDFDGWGQRDHSWGVRDWWTPSWCWSAFRVFGPTEADPPSLVHAVTLLPEQAFAVGYLQHGDEHLSVGTLAVDPTMGTTLGTGPAAAGEYTVVAPGHDPWSLMVEPVAWSPVRLDAPDGRISHFPRALCRVDHAGTPGIGWIEFNLPQP